MIDFRVDYCDGEVNCALVADESQIIAFQNFHTLGLNIKFQNSKRLKCSCNCFSICFPL